MHSVFYDKALIPIFSFWIPTPFFVLTLPGGDTLIREQKIRGWTHVTFHVNSWGLFKQSWCEWLCFCLFLCFIQCKNTQDTHRALLRVRTLCSVTKKMQRNCANFWRKNQSSSESYFVSSPLIIPSVVTKVLKWMRAILRHVSINCGKCRFNPGISGTNLYRT